MLGKIRATKSSLRKSEQRVADIVLADPETAVKTSIAALARIADVSEPTVMRFCQALGCDGFQEFKLQLAQDLGSRMRYAYQDISSDDSSGPLAEKVIDGTIASLVQLRRQLDSSTRAFHVLFAALDLSPQAGEEIDIVAQLLIAGVFRGGPHDEAGALRAGFVDQIA
jgi:RpiR family carbohydrate utilization transcriptional regulator